MKLIKIRFTAWCEVGIAPRTPAVQRLIAYWNARVSALSRDAAHLRDLQDRADSDGLLQSLAQINVDLEKVEVERTLLLTAEAAERNAIADGAGQHKRVGTFGYQIVDDKGTRATRVVDEGGNDLPHHIVFSFELVEDLPPSAERAIRLVRR